MIFERTKKFIRERKDVYVEGSIANSTFIILKYFVNLEDASLYSQLIDCTRQLLKATNLNQSVEHKFVIALLARLGRLNQEFITQIVREDLIR